MKKKYIAPQIEVIRIETEGGIMALSANGPTTPGTSTDNSSSSSGKSFSELADEIFNYER